MLKLTKRANRYGRTDGRTSLFKRIEWKLLNRHLWNKTTGSQVCIHIFNRAGYMYLAGYPADLLCRISGIRPSPNFINGKSRSKWRQEMRGEVGKKPPKKEWIITNFYDVTCCFFKRLSPFSISAYKSNRMSVCVCFSICLYWRISLIWYGSPLHCIFSRVQQSLFWGEGTIMRNNFFLKNMF